MIYSSFLKFFIFFSSLHVFGQPKNKIKPVSQSITKESLITIFEQNKHFAKDGKVANYIPELGKMNANAIALSVVTKNGKIINVGDVNQKFTMQSIAKTIALFVAVQENGEDAVFNKMGYFGTDRPFNSFESLETSGKPLNPMMNAGAILTTSMISGEGEIGFQKI